MFSDNRGATPILKDLGSEQKTGGISGKGATLGLMLKPLPELIPTNKTLLHFLHRENGSEKMCLRVVPI